MLTLLTTTGLRPEAWELCKRWMRQQDYKGQVKWVVVDDGEKPMNMSGIPRGWQLVAVYPAPTWKPGMNTQARNLREGLGYIEDDERVVIIEDDDYYAPQYLRAVDQWLDNADLVGECNSRYYNVKTRRWAYCGNHKHCSLMSTAVKGPALEVLRRMVDVSGENKKFIDIELWTLFRLDTMICETTLTVGIKGLPGRPGIGVGHRLSSGPTDHTGRTLRQWIGDDAEAYL